MLNIPYQIKNRKVNVRKRKEKSNELDEWVLNILEKGVYPQDWRQE